MFWVSVPGGGAPFIALEQISNDQSAAHLLKAILELQRMQVAVAGRVINPVRANFDCGLALLVAAVEGWNRMSVSTFLRWLWHQLRTNGAVDWTDKTRISWCRTHIIDAITLWHQTKLRCVGRSMCCILIGLGRCAATAKQHFQALSLHTFYLLESAASIVHAESCMRFFIWLVSSRTLALVDEKLQIPAPPVDTCNLHGLLSCAHCA